MDYQETIDFMFNSLPMFQRQGKAAYKANLDNSIAFDKHLRYPHKDFKSIHIAGTNGKGSTSHMLASILQEAGYRVGLYTSPHLKDYRERIRINGEMIPKAFVVDFIENNKAFISEISPSFFEMTVFLAFEYFKESKIDIAIIETGMGGRLDSTNLIKPELSIITNISLDHTQFLGDTIKKIAIEKAGIIKEKTPVIIGESNISYNSVFIEKAKQKNSNIIFADQLYKIPYGLNSLNQTQSFDVLKEEGKAFEGIEIDLLGHYQKKNLCTVLASLEFINLDIPKATIYNGLKNIIKNTNLMGRWQTLGSNPQIICDTGHNEAGVKLILEQLKQTAYKDLHIVWGMVNDKSIDRIMAILPKDAAYYFTKANIPRALNEVELHNIAKKYNLKGRSFSTVASAIREAELSANQNDLIFIGGSTFVVAELV